MKKSLIRMGRNVSVYALDQSQQCYIDQIVHFFQTNLQLEVQVDPALINRRIQAPYRLIFSASSQLKSFFPTYQYNYPFSLSTILYIFFKTDFLRRGPALQAYSVGEQITPA